MKKNIKFLAIILSLTIIFSIPIINMVRKKYSSLDEWSEDSIHVANINEEVIGVNKDKYGSYSYIKYANPRYGFSIEYPSFLTEKRESEKGEGAILQNKENTVVLILSGTNNVLQQNVEEIYQGYVNNTKGITHKKIIGNSFIIAADNENNSYFIYEEVGGGSINTFIIGYPKEDAKEFSKIIKHMKETFEAPYIHEVK